MRKSLSGPVFLMEWYTPEAPSPEQVSDLVSASWRGPSQKKWRLESQNDECFGVFTAWQDGSSARDARAAWVRGEQWRSLATGLAKQPEIHLFVADGPAWEAGPASMALVTVDAERVIPAGGKRLRSPVAREALPDVACALLWTTIGHPGRLLVRCSDGAALEAALARLREVWGPEAEPPARWRVAATPC